MKLEWTDERIAFLTGKWKEGWSAAQIAKHLGVTRSAAIGKLNRMGLVGFKPVAKPKGPKLPAGNGFYVKSVPLVPKPVPDDGISLYDLTSTTCRWPIGHPVSFCGVFCDEEKPYCEKHTNIARRG